MRMGKKIVVLLVTVLTGIALCLPGLALDPAAPVEINLTYGPAKLSAGEVTYYTWNTDSGIAQPVRVTGNFPAAGYRIIGTQATGTALEINAPVVPVTIGQGGSPEPAYQISGTLKTAAPLTVNGRIEVLGNVEITAGKTAVSGKLSIKGNGNTLPGVLTVSGTGALAAGEIETVSDASLGGTAPAGEAYAVTTGAFYAAGKATVSAPVHANTFRAGKDVQILPGGVLTLDANQARTATGTLDAGGALRSDGALTAADSVRSTGDMTLGGSARAGSFQSVNGNLTAGSRIEATRGGIAVGGKVSLQNGASVSASISAASATLNGTTAASGVSVAGALETGGNLTVSGTLKADSMILGGTVRAKTLDSRGNVTVRGNASTEGDARIREGAFALESGRFDAQNLDARGGVTLRAPVNIRSGLKSGGAVTVENGGRIERAASVTAQRLSTPGALELPDTSVKIGDGGIEAGGKLIIGSGASAGTVYAPSITLRGAFEALSLEASQGLVSAEGRLHAAGGGITASDGITLNGPVRAAGAVTAKNGDIIASSSAPVEKAASIRAEKGVVRLGAKAAVDGEIFGRDGVTIESGAQCASVRSDNTITLAGPVQCKSISAGGRLTIKDNTQVTDTISASSTDVLNGAVVTSPRFNGTVSGTTLQLRTRWNNAPDVAVTVQPDGKAARTVHAATDGDGYVILRGLGSGRHTLSAMKDGVTDSRIIALPGSGVTQLDLHPQTDNGNLRPLPPDGNHSGGGSSGSGGSAGSGGQESSFDEDEFWDEVVERIKAARKGDIVRVSASKAEHVPVTVLQALKGRPITLKMTHGKYSVEIDGDNMYKIPSNRIYYLFEDLADLYAEPPERESSSSSQASSSSSQSSSIWEFPSVELPASSAPAASQGGTWTPPAKPAETIPSSSEEEEESEPEESSSEESSEEESSSEEDKEVIADETPEPKKGFPIGVIIGLAVLGIAAGGGIAAYLLRGRLNKDEYDDFTE